MSNSISILFILLAVGLLGEQIKSILVFESIDSKILSISSWKSLVSFISLMRTSLIFAQTLYIPYVGGQVIILLLPGSQKIRKARSITSSLPLPIKIFCGGTPFILERSCFNFNCNG